ncbi:XAC0095 family protein [Lysobacter enzymogenes]|uniref:XAC0095 family protein n=1 Tax=Lysobacter enzymogenes TaxID=69 RepID=UPI001A95667A|nr:hypothetical protein [Lysobacter enzymogenes]QQP95871.1 hypothetical protein JHW38_22070 [Lysobacter enzymogenes]
MRRKSPSTAPADYVLLPVEAYRGLQAFYDELIGVAQTIDPVTPPASEVDATEQSRRRALARVFRLWADQVHGNLQAARSD